MRSVNCRNIRREIEALGPGRLFSAAVAEHLEHCSACETLSRQQNELHELVSSLGRVEAPADFDVRLRARLAGEERESTRSFALGDWSFGLRSAAVAAVLLVIGSAFVFVSFRSRPDAQIAGAKQVVINPVAPDSKAAPIESAVKANDTNVAKAPQVDQPLDQPRGSAPIHHPRGNSGVRNEVAGLRGNRVGTRDQSLTSAGVLRRGEQLTEAYPTAAFPINASNQSLKVSVDNGNGASRTISLPTVSFGSQRSLSNNASPLMAQARGTW
jgi:hypothetical protein